MLASKQRPKHFDYLKAASSVSSVHVLINEQSRRYLDSNSSSTVTSKSTISKEATTFELQLQRKLFSSTSSANSNNDLFSFISKITVDNLTIENSVITFHRVFIRIPDEANLAVSSVGWVLSAEMTHCMCCKVRFMTLFGSKCHCRACGDVVCKDCSLSTSLITGLSEFGRVRVCKSCFKGNDMHSHTKNNSRFGELVLSNDCDTDDMNDLVIKEKIESIPIMPHPSFIPFNPVSRFSNPETVLNKIPELEPFDEDKLVNRIDSMGDFTIDIPDTQRMSNSIPHTFAVKLDAAYDFKFPSRSSHSHQLFKSSIENQYAKQTHQSESHDEDEDNKLENRVDSTGDITIDTTDIQRASYAGPHPFAVKIDAAYDFKFLSRSSHSHQLFKSSIENQYAKQTLQSESYDDAKNQETDDRNCSLVICSDGTLRCFENTDILSNDQNHRYSANSNFSNFSSQLNTLKEEDHVDNKDCKQSEFKTINHKFHSAIGSTDCVVTIENSSEAKFLDVYNNDHKSTGSIATEFVKNNYDFNILSVNKSYDTGDTHHDSNALVSQNVWNYDKLRSEFDLQALELSDLKKQLLNKTEEIAIRDNRIDELFALLKCYNERFSYELQTGVEDAHMNDFSASGTGSSNRNGSQSTGNSNCHDQKVSETNLELVNLVVELVNSTGYAVETRSRTSSDNSSMALSSSYKLSNDRTTLFEHLSIDYTSKFNSLQIKIEELKIEKEQLYKTITELSNANAVLQALVSHGEFNESMFDLTQTIKLLELKLVDANNQKEDLKNEYDSNSKRLKMEIHQKSVLYDGLLKEYDCYRESSLATQSELANDNQKLHNQNKQLLSYFKEFNHHQSRRYEETNTEISELTTDNISGSNSVSGNNSIVDRNDNHDLIMTPNGNGNNHEPTVRLTETALLNRLYNQSSHLQSPISPLTPNSHVPLSPLLIPQVPSTHNQFDSPINHHNIYKRNQSDMMDMTAINSFIHNIQEENLAHLTTISRLKEDNIMLKLLSESGNDQHNNTNKNTKNSAVQNLINNQYKYNNTNETNSAADSPSCSIIDSVSPSDILNDFDMQLNAFHSNNSTNEHFFVCNTCNSSQYIQSLLRKISTLQIDQLLAEDENDEQSQKNGSVFQMNNPMNGIAFTEKNNHSNILE
eukprot:gene10561-14187_t